MELISASSLGAEGGWEDDGARARDGGNGEGASVRLALGASGVIWNGGSGHQKQHLPWRWDVGGASKWALQPECANPPQRCMGRRVPGHCPGGRRV